MMYRTHKNALMFRLGGWRQRFLFNKYYQLFFFSLILSALAIEIMPKPDSIENYAPHLVIAVLFAFIFTFPKLNISFEILIIGLILDIVYGINLGVSSFSLLVSYGALSLVLSMVCKLGQGVRILTFIIVIVIQRLITIWVLAYLSQSKVTLFLNIESLITTIISALIIDIILFHYLNGSETHAILRSIPR